MNPSHLPSVQRYFETFLRSRYTKELVKKKTEVHYTKLCLWELLLQDFLVTRDIPVKSFI